MPQRSQRTYKKTMQQIRSLQLVKWAISCYFKLLGMFFCFACSGLKAFANILVYLSWQVGCFTCKSVSCILVFVIASSLHRSSCFFQRIGLHRVARCFFQFYTCLTHKNQLSRQKHLLLHEKKQQREELESLQQLLLFLTLAQQIPHFPASLLQFKINCERYIEDERKQLHTIIEKMIWKRQAERQLLHQQLLEKELIIQEMKQQGIKLVQQMQELQSQRISSDHILCSDLDNVIETMSILRLHRPAGTDSYQKRHRDQEIYSYEERIGQYTISAEELEELETAASDFAGPPTQF